MSAFKATRLQYSMHGTHSHPLSHIIALHVYGHIEEYTQWQAFLTTHTHTQRGVQIRQANWFLMLFGGVASVDIFPIQRLRGTEYDSCHIRERIEER